jgi:hypothetical protein
MVDSRRSCCDQEVSRMSDGGLHKLFAQYVPDSHWQRIETGGIARGVPDLNGCRSGVEVWIENKLTTGWTVKVRPAQVGWLERRARAGGRCFVAVRQTSPGTSLRRDDLWLLSPWAARPLIDGARLSDLDPAHVHGHWGRPPARWDWSEISLILFDQVIYAAG